MITRIDDEADVDPYIVEENRKLGAERIQARVPVRYQSSGVSVPEVKTWVDVLLRRAVAARPLRPIVRYGPSLVLLGATGTGKTYQAYGAMIALSTSGAGCQWIFATAADIYARLRPRPRVDSEEEFARIANAPVLGIDDLGAAKATEWTEEVNYRLINHRYEHELPTLITSNVTPKTLATTLGERVASRLVEMADRVVLDGADRRRVPTEAVS